MVSFAVLQKQDDKTSDAVITKLKGNPEFERLSKSEGDLIVTRDAEDERKLAVGIDLAIGKGVLSKIPPPSVAKINVVGKTAEEVAGEVLTALGPLGAEGKVLVLQGLSGTGKGTTVKKLQEKLPKCVCWSNGNVFRSVTYLVSEHCSDKKVEFGPSVLTAELLAAMMKRLSFKEFADGYDVEIAPASPEGTATRVSAIANTALKQPVISSRVPTVAEQTQGEVVLFARDAVALLSKAGHNVILEGRAQTLNYIPTPFRFELVIEDPVLLGQRRAAQRVMAAALESLKGTPSDAEVDEAIAKAAATLK